ncbi:hypothetical protein GALMADRAFT_266490 [Galerina marginata CBS 339.88]|uniref:Calcineurin-like phosphoesterase domain-containing protein n=1 Tax=Galerina marginata (strain CBS 339.88) TaxID=685588 RepID=A0A067TG15_GALM3|nr:hypothetical protein GALMADRAFT_266490 [Galerina marginata CBS 339.88]
MSTARRIRIVCISDTHNDDPTARIPNGDVLVHAGDMTDDGTQEELEKALAWIRNLPHKVKVIIPGNHDLGLDPSHKVYNPAMHTLFSSPIVQADGVVLLDKSRPTFLHDDLLSVYANSFQPDFLKSSYAFTYLPYPSPEATDAWASAPDISRGPLELWLTHGAPKGRLDQIHITGLMGCEAQRQKVATARPLVCVFGHFHCSYGVEKVVWHDTPDIIDGDSNGIKECVTLTDENRDSPYDFTSLKRGKETVFINAAWMTMEKGKVEKRNKPIVIDLEYSVPPN